MAGWGKKQIKAALAYANGTDKSIGGKAVYDWLVTQVRKSADPTFCAGSSAVANLTTLLANTGTR